MLLRFISFYALLAFLFTLLSWGHAEPQGRLPNASTELAVHLLLHLALGVAAALPSRRLSLMAASGLAVLVIDVDHIGWGVGIPTVSHASHSVGFALLVGATTWALARRGFFPGVPPLLLAAVAAASVPAHMAADAISSGRVPLWAPVTFARVDLSPPLAVLFMLGAMLLVWGALALCRRGPKVDVLIQAKRLSGGASNG